MVMATGKISKLPEPKAPSINPTYYSDIVAQSTFTPPETGWYFMLVVSNNASQAPAARLRNGSTDVFCMTGYPNRDTGGWVYLSKEVTYNVSANYMYHFYVYK